LRGLAPAVIVAARLEGRAMILFVRLAALVGAALTLAACNGVTSPEPLFTEADRTGAPTPEPGVWAAKDCTAELALRHAQVCAWRYEVTPTTVRMTFDDDAPKSAGDASVVPNASKGEEKDEPAPYLLAASDPPIMQLGGADDDAYVYFAVKPVSRGHDGRVIEADVWPVLCGPPAKPKSDAELAQLVREDPHYVEPPTDAPFPGIKIVGRYCQVRDRRSLINAARASRDVEEETLPPNKPGGKRVHWIASVTP
jgi:hypothetical protein